MSKKLYVKPEIIEIGNLETVVLSGGRSSSRCRTWCR
ncbi:hypothetical protein Calla_1705 [Caldicellulosiruptor acetigenus 6A]|uniref:Uncharacterized protein n=1 Tax=Caldicellulosiruptor acetigenus 6A TaxID=632516 RepID=G2PTL6_9FIRM|nr:hypothetical protein Calla_1705 [Caldicellulosiruptor acetigenus 6A]